jgi:hypothetical protein
MEAILHRIKAWLYDNALTTEAPNVIPALIADGYTLEVTTQYSSNQLLKEPRTFAFDKVLTVQ